MATKFFYYKNQDFSFYGQIESDSLNEILLKIKEMWSLFPIVVAENGTHTIYADKNDPNTRIKVRIDCQFKG